jgi:hypothetical protein
MSKIIFVLHRRPDLSRQACLEQWSGEAHISICEASEG